MHRPRRQKGVINLGGIGIVLTIAFVFYCALGDRGDERMTRICSPFAVTSNLFTSIAALIYDGSEVPVKEVFDNITYGCKYTVWRLSYEKDYQKYVDERTRKGLPIPPTAEQVEQARREGRELPKGEAPDPSGLAPPIKPVRPAIDVKGAIEGIDVPELPPLPGRSREPEPKAP